MKKRVIVIGAGVAGLGAAHELVARGYDVTVLEAGGASQLGGKSRSQYWRHPRHGVLPGEHGYRFFPGFYRHLPELMSRIPQNAAEADPAGALEPYPDSVADRLVSSQMMAIAFPDEPMIATELRLPPTDRLAEFVMKFLDTALRLDEVDLGVMATRYIAFLLASEAERDAMESVTLWDYVEADTYEERSQRLLNNVPRALVAMDARQGNARTFLNTFFLMNMEALSATPHRVLNGPTSATWIEPWTAWLRRLGVKVLLDHRVAGFAFDPVARRITGAKVAAPNEAVLEADHFVLCVPYEAAIRLVSDEMAHACRECAKLASATPRRLALVLGDMTGAQLYLRRPIRPRHGFQPLFGHVALPLSPWGLSAVAQSAFWQPHHLPAGIEEVLSICITNLAEETYVGPSGMTLAPDDLRAALVDQLRHALDEDGQPWVDHEDILALHLDDDLEIGPQGVVANRARLIIHPPGFEQDRPKPTSQIENLAFAGDYVSNPVDLATMEGATYTARAAVNVVLDRDDATASRCPLYDIRGDLEPAWLAILRDANRPGEARLSGPPSLDRLRARDNPLAEVARWARAIEAAVLGGIA